MAGYRVELAPQAVKDIKGLSTADQKKVIRTLESLAINPRPIGVEKLKENPSFWRIWIGRDHRMIYTIEDKLRVVVVALVRNRSDAYRGISRLSAATLIAEIKPMLSQPRPPRRNQ